MLVHGAGLLAVGDLLKDIVDEYVVVETQQQAGLLLDPRQKRGRVDAVIAYLHEHGGTAGSGGARTAFCRKRTSWSKLLPLIIKELYLKVLCCLLIIS